MKVDAYAYNITVRRGEFEGETLFEARVKELPDLVEYGDTFDEAHALAVDAIETTAAIFAEKGRMMTPPTVPADDYSGRVTLRLPKSLHRALAEAADTEGASLNQHLVNVLTYYSGFAAGRRHEGKSPWQVVEPAPRQREKAGVKLTVVRDEGFQLAASWQ